MELSRNAYSAAAVTATATTMAPMKRNLREPPGEDVRVSRAMRSPDRSSELTTKSRLQSRDQLRLGRRRQIQKPGCVTGGQEQERTVSDSGLAGNVATRLFAECKATRWGLARRRHGPIPALAIPV